MSHSISTAIDKELKTLILNTANNDHAPMIGKVASISDDYQYVDVTLARGGTLPAVKIFYGEPEVGAETLLIFVDGDGNDPRAIISDVTPQKPYYNIFYNGNFGVINGNVFDNWTGGKLCTISYYGENGCEILPGTSLVSNLFDVSTIENEAFTVSFVWQGGAFTLEVLDEDDNFIGAVPDVLGTMQQMGSVPTWSYQRYNYLTADHDKIKIRFRNNDTESTFIDGVRVWKPDDYQEWFPNINDEEGVKILSKNYKTLLNTQSGFHKQLKKVILDIDDRLKSVELGSIVSDAFAPLVHTHDEYVKKNQDTALNSTMLDFHTADEFAMANHVHNNVVYVTRFTTQTLTSGSCTINTEIDMTNGDYYILDYDNDFSLTSKNNEGLVLHYDFTNEPTENSFVCLYWTSIPIDGTLLNSNISMNDIYSVRDEPVDIEATVTDDNGNPITMGNVDFEISESENDGND